jgi:hypothetical protein
VRFGDDFDSALCADLPCLRVEVEMLGDQQKWAPACSKICFWGELSGSATVLWLADYLCLADGPLPGATFFFEKTTGAPLNATTLVDHATDGFVHPRLWDKAPPGHGGARNGELRVLPLRAVYSGSFTPGSVPPDFDLATSVLTGGIADNMSFPSDAYPFPPRRFRQSASILDPCTKLNVKVPLVVLEVTQWNDGVGASGSTSLVGKGWLRDRDRRLIKGGGTSSVFSVYKMSGSESSNCKNDKAMQLRSNAYEQYVGGKLFPVCVDGKCVAAVRLVFTGMSGDGKQLQLEMGVVCAHSDRSRPCYSCHVPFEDFMHIHPPDDADGRARQLTGNEQALNAAKEFVTLARIFLNSVAGTKPERSLTALPHYQTVHPMLNAWTSANSPHCLRLASVSAAFAVRPRHDFRGQG